MSSKESTLTLLTRYEETLAKVLALGDREVQGAELARAQALQHGRDLLTRLTRRQASSSGSQEEMDQMTLVIPSLLHTIIVVTGHPPFARDVAQVASSAFAFLLPLLPQAEANATLHSLWAPTDTAYRRVSDLSYQLEEMLARSHSLLTLPLVKALFSHLPFPQLCGPGLSGPGSLLVQDLWNATLDRSSRPSSCLMAQVVAYEALTMLMSRARQGLAKLNNPALHHRLMSQIFGQSFQDHLLQIITDNCSNSEEVIQHKVHELHVQYLTLQVPSPSKEISPSFQPFIHSCWVHFTSLDWTKKIKYTLMEATIPYLSDTPLMEPSLLKDPIKALSNQSLASRAAKVLVSLMKRALGPSTKDTDSPRAFCLDIICTLLTARDSLVVNHTGTYILRPILEACPSLTLQLLRALGHEAHDPSLPPPAAIYTPKSGHPLRPIMTILQVARVLGILENDQQVQQYRVYDILEVAAYDQDDEIRVDALLFVVQQRRSTQSFSHREYAFLRNFLIRNINSTSPYFRQKVYKAVGKAVDRIHASVSLMRREDLARQQKGALSSLHGQAIQQALEFIQFLIQDLILTYSFFPGAQHPRIMTGLAILEHISSKIPPNPTRDPEVSHSIRTFVHSPELISSLLSLLRNRFEDVRHCASRFLSSPSIIPSPLPGIPSDQAIDLLLHQGTLLIGNLRAGDAETGALLIQLYLSKYVLYPSSLSVNDSGGGDVEKIRRALGVLDLAAPSSLNASTFIQGLVDALELKVQRAEADLIDASLHHPLHGSLLTLEKCLGLLPRPTSTVANTAPSSLPLVHILSLTQRIIASVHAVLSDESPEGNWILEDGGEGLDELFKAVGPKHQVLSSFCWRAMKGSSGVIQAVLPLLQPDQLSGLATMVRTLHQTLLDLRHRGAFTHLVPAFQDTCRLLTHLSPSLHPELTKQPDLLLEHTVNMISAYHVSVTRRSAALPWAIVSILECMGQEDMDRVVAQLSSIARVPFQVAKEGGEEEEDLPQVHALNSLRLILSHSGFGLKTTPYLGDSLILVLQGFSSPSWAIRNCSLMCFSTLVGRIFGRKHLAKEVSLSISPASSSSSSGSTSGMENTLTTREFFHRYPKVRKVLEEGLMVGSHEGSAARGSDGSDTPITKTSIHSNRHLGYHPILTLLASLDTTSTSLSHSGSPNDLHTLQKATRALLLDHPMMYVRNMAAKAYVALLAPDTITSECDALLDMVLRADEGPFTQPGRANRLHGILMALRAGIGRQRFTRAGFTLSWKGPALDQAIKRLWMITHTSVPFLSALAVECILWSLAGMEEEEEEEEKEEKEEGTGGLLYLKKKVGRRAVKELARAAYGKDHPVQDPSLIGWDRWVEQLIRLILLSPTPSTLGETLSMEHPFLRRILLNMLYQTLEETSGQAGESLLAGWTKENINSLYSTILEIAKSTDESRCLSSSLLILSSLQRHHLPSNSERLGHDQAIKQEKEDLGQVLIRAEATRISSVQLLPLQGRVHGQDPWGPGSVQWCVYLLTMVQPRQSPAYREAGAVAMVSFLGQASLGNLDSLSSNDDKEAGLTILDILVTLLQDDDEEVRNEIAKAFENAHLQPCPEYALTLCFNRFKPLLPEYRAILIDRMQANRKKKEEEDNDVLFFEEPENTYAEATVVLRYLDQVMLS
ncbi:putative death-receptor fusion protein-domain-containing protein [Piptocephalis cylindrospora]|uniref:Putative death-receptor fusion protein-domain-containing protein n=1 Tax=Piptocephalis cylindrospora TaxID=1907219 RepID=A0A4P9Y9W4_9FUNG|nr:putative death-receptor fusion protein-domain-containing protein [Piptocephalis cylindrospora]|eukprot:RKP15241.1 putative death-receptor fusion protein-domain-containing protein [Piptocephalis cylindrospora]